MLIPEALGLSRAISSADCSAACSADCSSIVFGRSLRGIGEKGGLMRAAPTRSVRSSRSRSQEAAAAPLAHVVLDLRGRKRQRARVSIHGMSGARAHESRERNGRGGAPPAISLSRVHGARNGAGRRCEAAVSLSCRDRAGGWVDNGPQRRVSRLLDGRSRTCEREGAGGARPRAPSGGERGCIGCAQTA